MDDIILYYFSVFTLVSQESQSDQQKLLRAAFAIRVSYKGVCFILCILTLL